MADIRHAWCSELNDVLTPHQAKREYFAMDPRPDKLHFFCADARCRQATSGGTRVTCVNYTVLPSEEAQSVVVHYRVLDKHQPGCTASGEHVPEDKPPVEGGPPGNRKAKTKRSDSFQVFDPASGSETQRPPGTPGGGGGIGGISGGGSGGGGGGAPRSDESISSTRFVEDLAALHCESLTKPEVKALLDEEFEVRGVGSGRLADLFRPVKRAFVGASNFIWYGGARFKRYGRGFRLTFIDAVEGCRLSTYVSPDDMKAYRYRSLLEATADAAEACNYVKVYVWGTIARSERDGEASLNPERLQHLAVILGPIKQPADGKSSEAPQA